MICFRTNLKIREIEIFEKGLCDTLIRNLSPKLIEFVIKLYLCKRKPIVVLLR